MLNDYTLNALVVDDTATMRAMLKTMLASLGVTRLAEAPSAALAIEKLRVEQFDLLLLDYYLGDATDGQQLLELIRNERLVASSAVIVMVTAETAYGAVAKVAEHSPDAYLIKPFTADALHERLLPVLERKMGMRYLNKKTPGLKPIYDQYDAGCYAAVIALVDAYTAREGVHADTARLKGDALMQLGDYVVALEHYRSLADSHAWAGLGVARVLTLLYQHEAAIATLERLVAAAPLYVHAADVLAQAYIKTRQVDRALAVLESACAKSPTVNRMRVAAQLAEQLGEDERVVKWAGKVVDANKFALEQDCNDHARLIRGLVKTGQLDKAVSTVLGYETDIPQTKQSAGVQASKALLLAAQIAKDEAELANAPASIRARRLALQAGKRERLDALTQRLAEMSPNPQEAALVSEALLAVGQDDRGAEAAAIALANGLPLAPNLGDAAWREQAAAQARQRTKARIMAGLDLFRDGKTKEALGVFMALVQHTPPDLTAQLLANVVSSVIMLRQRGDNVTEFLPAARTALERLKLEYPGYDRLPGLIHGFEGKAA